MAMHSDSGWDKVICAWDENNKISQVGRRTYPNNVLSQYIREAVTTPPQVALYGLGG